MMKIAAGQEQALDSEGGSTCGKCGWQERLLSLYSP